LTGLKDAISVTRRIQTSAAPSAIPKVSHTTQDAGSRNVSIDQAVPEFIEGH
jgi:hypothetical protein